MDILNFISWVKKGVRYITTVPTDTAVLLPLAAKDMTRDDEWLTLALNADGLKPLYNKGTVTQATSITTGVTVNTASGVITTVSSTLASLAEATFTVTNSVVKPGSVILVSTEYLGTGHADAGVATIGTGTFDITVANQGSVALNSVIKIHYIIIA
jgi:hypothetical protein